jgi:ribosome-associated toxin RatA of RatAB toxin-antitoxin module
MPQIKKNALLPYPAGAMFRLVDRVEDYPEFLPWCAASEVHSRDAEHTLATVAVDFKALRERFTTYNHKQDETKIELQLRDGPFRVLRGQWRFLPLAAGACRVEFELEYEFASKLKQALAGGVFGLIAGGILDAFVARARELAQRGALR